VYKSSDNGATWTLGQKLLADDGAAGDKFGFAVSVYSDVIVVGAYLDDDKGGNSGILSLFVLMLIYEYIYIMSVYI
jgi:hypothetical protein